jgi:polygalacturonase
MRIVVKRSGQLMVGAVLCVAGMFAQAQDTRTVTEPVISPSCTVLTAQLASPLADTDEAKLDTARIQAALDSCAKGKAVELKADGAKNAFLSGPLQLRAGVILLVDKGVTLYGSRDAKVYAIAPDSCGIVNKVKQRGCRPLIAAVGAADTGIMGAGIIDGRGGAKILGKSDSWWDLAEEARKDGNQQVPRLIDTDHTDNFVLYRITLKNSAMTHVAVHHANGVTVWGLKIDTPESARNTDGFDPAASTNITVTNSYIRDGDDDIAIKAGDGPVTHMTVIHNHFYSGHGMSIGSETSGGVSTLLVRDLSLDGTTWGIRLKSNATRGGLVDGAQYDDICIRNSKIPISITTDYYLPGSTPDSLPVFRNILLHNVRISGGTRFELEGFDATHRVGIQLDGVMVTDSPARYKTIAKHADVTLGPGPVNLPLAGDDSTVAGKAGSGSLPGCAEKFVPFPVTP